MHWRDVAPCHVERHHDMHSCDRSNKASKQLMYTPLPSFRWRQLDANLGRQSADSVVSFWRYIEGCLTGSLTIPGVSFPAVSTTAMDHTLPDVEAMFDHIKYGAEKFYSITQQAFHHSDSSKKFDVRGLDDMCRYAYSRGNHELRQQIAFAFWNWPPLCASC